MTDSEWRPAIKVAIVFVGSCFCWMAVLGFAVVVGAVVAG